MPFSTESHGEDDFAELGAGFEISVSGGGFRERENVIDDGFEFSCGHELEHRVELGLRSHVGTEKRKLAAEEKTQSTLAW